MYKRQALYALYKDNRLPEDFAVLGIGRTEYQDDTYRTYIRTEMERFVAPEEHADNRMADFCDRLHYLSLNPAGAADYGKLAARLQELTGEQEPDGMLYYLATPPSLYGVIPLHLKAAGLNRPHTRIIVEKPFGTRFTVSTTSWARKPRRIFWRSASPTVFSSRFGTVTTSTT